MRETPKHDNTAKHHPTGSCVTGGSDLNPHSCPSKPLPIGAGAGSQHYVVLLVPLQKPGLDGLALAFEIISQAKAVVGPSPMAWLGPAYLGPAWLGPQPETGPGTALLLKKVISDHDP